MKSILLVEDDLFIIDIYRTKFKEAGFDIDTAENGEEALSKLKENPPTLLILDIVLPNIDGWELLRKIRNEPNFQDLKVVVLSNLSSKSEVEKGSALGVIKYFVKSNFTPGEVVNEIKEILKDT